MHAKNVTLVYNEYSSGNAILQCYNTLCHYPHAQQVVIDLMYFIISNSY